MALFDSDRVEVVRDNRGSLFLVDWARERRYPITGQGQLDVATRLFGDVREQADDGGDVFLTGFREGPSVVDLYGGPNGIEQVVAGDASDPIVGETIHGERAEHPRPDDDAPRFDNDRFEVVEDNRGVLFVIDRDRQMRFRVTGEGQLQGAVSLFGPVRTEEDDGSPVELTGWREGPSVVELYGGPGGIEEVVAGERRDPLAGEFIPGIGDELDPVDDDEVNRDARARIGELLRNYGLEGLIDDAWEWVKEGLSETEIVQRIRETDAYAERFPGMKMRRDAGLPAMSEREYIQYERQARQLMQQSGLPSSFYDTPDDLAEFIGADMALPELSARLTEGFGRVSEAPQEVRDAFADMFGGHGDDALAAFFLDEERSLPALERAASMSETAGAGAVFDFDVDRQMAEELVDFGVGFDEAMQGFGEAARLRPLTGDLAFERRGQVSEDDLVGARFGVDDQARERLQRRMEARVASFQGGGRALMGQQGISGAGRARRR